MHPLCGANISTFAQVLSESGGAPAAYWPKLAGIGAAICGRSIASVVEGAALAGRLPAPTDMPPPIFILGHWRSGTTHLYNIMAKGQFGYVSPLATGLPWDLLGLGRLVGPLLERSLPENRYIDNIPVKPDSPQEDEFALANMTRLSFYHGVFFPQLLEKHLARGLFFDDCTARDVEEWSDRFTYFMSKLYLHQDRKQLLIKNPVYTARAGLLRKLYPNAKFIHIYRNPYRVFASMRNFYKKLFKEFALQPYEGVDIDGAILKTYTRMMKTFDEDRAGIEPENFVELRCEDMDGDAIGCVGRVYEGLGLEGWTEDRVKFEAYLESVKNFEKNKFSYTDEDASLVEAHWSEYIERWGYQRPGAEASAA